MPNKFARLFVRSRTWSGLSRVGVCLRKHGSQEFRWRKSIHAGKSPFRLGALALAILAAAALCASAHPIEAAAAPAADEVVSFRLLHEGFGDREATSRDGCRLLLRTNPDETRYYELSVSRRDNTIAIRKKSTDLVLLTPEIPHGAAYDQWQDVRANARNLSDGSVAIELYSGGTLLASAIDDGSAGGPPLRDAGRVVLHSENARLDVSGFRVQSALGAAPQTALGYSPPQLAALSPASISAGGPALDLALDGSGFSTKAVVRWNGSERPTFRQGDGRLIVRLSPQDVASPGEVPVTVSNPGAPASNALAFSVESGVLSAEIPNR